MIFIIRARETVSVEITKITKTKTKQIHCYSLGSVVFDFDFFGLIGGFLALDCGAGEGPQCQEYLSRFQSVDFT